MKVFLRRTRGLYETETDFNLLISLQKQRNLPITATFDRAWDFESQRAAFESLCHLVVEHGSGGTIGIQEGIAETSKTSNPKPNIVFVEKDNGRRLWYQKAGEVLKRHNLSAAVFLDNEEYNYQNYCAKVISPVSEDEWKQLRSRREEAWVNDAMHGLRASSAWVDSITLYGYLRPIPQVRRLPNGRPAISGWGVSGNVGSSRRPAQFETQCGEMFFWQFPEIMAATLNQCRILADYNHVGTTMSHWILRAREVGGNDKDHLDPIMQAVAGRMYSTLRIETVWCHLAPVSPVHHAMYKLLWAQEMPAFLDGVALA